MPTVNFIRPLTLTFLSLGFYWYFGHPISNYDNQLVLVIVEIKWFESDENRDLHPRGNVTRILVWVLDIRNYKLFCLKRCYFYPLDVFRSIYETDFALINFADFKVSETNLLWLNSEYICSRVSCGLKCLDKGQSFS